MKRFIACTWTVFTMILLFLGCSAVRDNPTNETTTSPTVEDIFQNPETTEPKPYETTLPSNECPTEQTTPSEETAPPSPEGMFLGSLSAGPQTWSTDDKGPYLTYEGGEMAIPFEITATGALAERTIGIILFVDGQPQPYRTNEDSEYKYMHIFKASLKGVCRTTLMFVPVTGKQGDDLEIYAKPLLDPLRTLAENGQGPAITNTAHSSFRLKYNATPAVFTCPGTRLRLSESTVSFVDTTYDEIGSWSDQALIEKNETHLYVNEISDKGATTIFGISAETEVNLKFEIWGSPYVHYGIVFFVENEPVFATDGAPLLIEVCNGQKTVVEARLSMAQFDGESPVYAILVPRNYRSSKVQTTCGLDSSVVFFLTNQEKI